MRKLLFLLLICPFLLQAQSVHIVASDTTACNGSTITFSATASGVSVPHYKWMVNGITAGIDSSVLSTNSLGNGDTVKCLLINSVGDTIYANSDNIIVTVENMPYAGTITGPDEVCVGSTITLTASATGGLWRTSAGYAAVSGGIVTGIDIMGIFEFHIVPGFDTVFYYISNSCGTDSVGKEIFVITTPIAAFRLPDQLCVGIYVSMDNGNGDFQNVFSLQGFVNFSFPYCYPIKDGIDTICNIVTNGCGSDTFYQRTWIQPKPWIQNIRPLKDSICIGNTTVMVAEPLMGSPYWYSLKNNALLDAKTGQVTGNNPGIDTIVLRVSNTCGFASATTTINILPPGKIVGSDSLCKGDSKMLTNAYAGGTWGSSNAFVASVDQTGMLVGLESDTLLISYSLGTCTTSKKITVNPQPVISNNKPICPDEKLTLTNDLPGGRWQSSDIAIATVDSSGKVYGLASGNSIITYTSRSGCATTANVTVAHCDNDWAIYPNPAQGELIIEADTLKFNAYSLVNSIGKTICRTPVTQTFTKVDIRLLPQGVYFIHLFGYNRELVQKFVKD